MEYTLAVNTADCIGCDACEVACKQEHGLSVGLSWIKVSTRGPREIEGRQQLRYDVAHCLHCVNPGCREVCPVDAITKREDGIVLIDEELCTGCMACLDGCPLGVMQFDQEKALAEKCDLCFSRLDRGMNPACVAACPARCIHSGDLAEVVAGNGRNELLEKYKKTGA
ncbi:MAG: 4Fe-4S dicluster domain-containing protein [Dehalococcoidales bacterium]|mgnify:CR=1 FL=1|jgi:Fe-S-cluster-containing dehydrogenase component|nr:4Fe-4S ferredoxin [Dehalococcoidales bacterium]MDP6501188.1 4Fe-4S dicluster domain-containing protein [Dehalococcoidales bacterium]MDP6633220.1 4Fe-4S dicluster domain-containing protein [Dehalococcoidales bacterium]|tara:strand:+ start:515 stop:1018 length:504 start_codon:yes stop_codon:yes gene_type:complete